MLTEVSAVDGRAWTKQRIAFLEGLLQGDELSDEQRTATEAELQQLRSKKRGVLGWLFPGRLPHQR